MVFGVGVISLLDSQVTEPEFTLKFWEMPCKHRMVHISARIRTVYFPNTDQSCYYLKNPALLIVGIHD
jgi:hypothetical protein